MESNPAPDATQGRIVALSRDLFFGMRMRTIIRQLDYDLKLVNDEETLVEHVSQAAPRLVLVDFNQPVAWEKLTPVIASETPIVAFGSHTYVEAFRAAKEAGVDRTVSNGQFSRSLPELIEKYQR